MKKIYAFICAFTIAFTLTACGGQTHPTQNSVSSSVNQPVSSGKAESKVVSSKASSSKEVSSNTVSSNTASSNTASKVPSTKVVAEKSVGNYQIQTLSYSYKKDNMEYKASYPQLSGNIANLDKINAGIKNCALKTINSLGTGKKDARTTIKVNSDITYEGKNFISLGFNEYTKLSSKAETNRVLRTVNINLKTGAFVGAADMIVKNDAFYKDLREAAKEQLSAELAPAMTANVIKAGIDPDTIYFTEHGVGFSVQISKPEKRYLTLTLTFEQAKPYMTKSNIWKNFM